jgi:MFS family permease
MSSLDDNTTTGAPERQHYGVTFAVLALAGAAYSLLLRSRNPSGLIFARIVQGSGGAIFPLAFGIIRDEFPTDKAAQASP